MRQGGGMVIQDKEAHGAGGAQRIWGHEACTGTVPPARQALRLGSGGLGSARGEATSNTCGCHPKKTSVWSKLAHGSSTGGGKLAQGRAGVDSQNQGARAEPLGFWWHAQPWLRLAKQLSFPPVLRGHLPGYTHTSPG